MERRETFAARLSRARKERNISQEKIAEAAKISVRQYQKLEKGKAIPRLDTACRLAEVLGFSLEHLVFSNLEKE